MTDGEDNVVLRLLREMRAEQRDQSRALAKLDREVGELKEGMTTALGLAASANVRTDRAGEMMDELTDEIAAIKRRLSDLEARE